MRVSILQEVVLRGFTMYSLHLKHLNTISTTLVHAVPEKPILRVIVTQQRFCVLEDF